MEIAVRSNVSLVTYAQPYGIEIVEDNIHKEIWLQDRGLWADAYNDCSDLENGLYFIPATGYSICKAVYQGKVYSFIKGVIEHDWHTTLDI